MPYETREIDELKIPLGDDQFAYIAIVGDMKAGFEWNNGQWEVDHLDLRDYDTKEWVSIEDNPDFKSYVFGAELYASENIDPPSSGRNPNAEHRQGSRELGVGAFA